MRVLLLNPPGSRRYNRDYYCGQQSKGPYVFPPTDLLVMSGILRGRHEVVVLDAMAEGLSVKVALERIRRASPHVIVSLVSSVSWAEDSTFFAEVYRSIGAPILLSGDLPRAAPDLVLNLCEAVTGVVLDFADCELADFVEGKRFGLVNIHTRDGPALPSRNKVIRYPVPQHDRFPLRLYHHPLLSRHPYTTVITDFSCPFSCTFCPYERIPYKARDLDNVYEELAHVHGLGIRGLLINDACFGARPSHTMEMCRVLGSFSPPFHWICDMRVDHAAPEVLAMMRKAGCEVVQFGVETASPEILADYNKNIALEQVKAAFLAAREAGVRTLAHFILGLDGETRESQEQLITFALELDPDYASFGVAVPAWGTTFRDRLVQKGAIAPDDTDFDISAERPSWDSANLNRHDVEAVRRAAIRRFYFRPSYFLRRIVSLRTPYEVRMAVLQCLHLAKAICRSSKTQE